MTRHDPRALINILVNSFDVGAVLREAVREHIARTGESQEDIARAAGMASGNLSRALSNPNTRPETARALCRVLGLKLALVKDRS